MTDYSEDVAWLREQVKKDGIRYFMAMFVDMHGKPCAKMMPARSLDQLLNDGAGFAGFAVGHMGQDPSDPDLLAKPDPRSYMRLPWKPEVAVLHCNPHVGQDPWPYAPRVILQNMLDQTAERGWSLKTGVEAEYILVNRLEDGSIEAADPLDRSDKPCYEAKGLSRMWDHLAEISDYVNELGWGNYANDHEDAQGQFEQNFEFDDAMVTADRTIFFRYMVHMIAHKRGMAATFMPKPFRDQTGNGLHTHMSLWAGDEEVLRDDNDPRGLGLSSMGYSFLAGQVEHGKAMSSLIAPSVNSYKRIGVTAPTSGATWAPGYICHGGDNRTVMFRVTGGHIEHRGVCGSANPYLAFTGILAAGLDGIDRGLEAGQPIHENLYTKSDAEIDALGIVRFPGSLLEAVRELPDDAVLRAALGKVRDGDYIDYFAKIKEAEFREYHANVSAWEIKQYLTLF